MASKRSSNRILAHEENGFFNGETDSKVSTMPKEPPQDRLSFVLCSTCLFGTASLLPWNFFITATSYWNYKFRNTTGNPSMDWDNTNNTTPLQTTFTSYMIIVSKVPFLFFLLVNTAISHRFSPATRIGYPLLISILLFVVTTALVYVNTDENQSGFLAATLCIVGAINVVAAFLQGGGTGLAGCFPKKYMTSNVFGQAMGGIFASVAQVLAEYWGSSPQNSAFAYFLCASATLALTLVVFIFVIRTPFYKYYVSTQIGHSDISVEKTQKVPLLPIAKKIWLHSLSTILIFWVTLCIFPAVTVLVKSMNTGSSIWTGKLYLPIACFLLFNVCDIIGRVVATWLPLPSRRTGLLMILCILRIVFIPLFMLCNAEPRSHLPIVFHHDAYFICFIILMAVSNGYLYTIAMTNGPKVVKLEYQEMAGSMMAFSLGMGLMLGVVTSYGAVKLL